MERADDRHGQRTAPACERLQRHRTLSARGCAAVGTYRALALAERDGPQAALDALAPYVDDPRLVDYQPYWAARANLLERIGATTEALGAYDLAIGLERDPAVRRFLQRKRMELASART